MAVQRVLRVAVGVTRKFRLDTAELEEIAEDETDWSGTPTVSLKELVDGALVASAIATVGTVSIDTDDFIVTLTGVSPGRCGVYASCAADDGTRPGGKCVLEVE